MAITDINEAVKVYSLEETLWMQVKDQCLRAIGDAEKALILNKELLKLSEVKIDEQVQKRLSEREANSERSESTGQDSV